MDRKVSRAGRSGTCRKCGSGRLRLVWVSHQDKVHCRTCGAVVKPCKVDYPHNTVNGPRVYKAVDWLNAQHGKGVSRLDVAKHIGVSKSPHLIKALERMVSAKTLVRWTERSPLNGRTTIMYAPWVDTKTLPDAQQAPATAKRGISAPPPPWGRLGRGLASTQGGAQEYPGEAL